MSLKMSRKNQYFPISKMQLGLLYHSESSPLNQFYISQIKIKIHHAIDVELLKKSCHFILNKHAILRAEVNNPDLQQAEWLITPSVTLPFSITDLSKISAPHQAMQLQEILERNFHKKIDIHTAPLMHWHLIILSKTESVFVWTHHHALISGKEIALVLQELFYYYDHQGNVKPVQTELNDCDVYLNILQNYDPKPAQAYWKKLLNNYELCPLLIRQTPSNKPYQHQILANSFDHQFQQALHDVAKRYQVTDYTIISAAWGIVLSLFSNKSDLLFGTVRSFPETALGNAVGLFINTLPIRVQFDKKTTKQQFYNSIREQQVQIKNVVHTPLSELHKLLKVEPGDGLFQTYIDYKPQSINEILQNSCEEWQKREWDYRLDTHYKIHLELFGEKNHLIYRVHFDENSYASESMKLLLDYFANVMQTLVQDDFIHIAEIDGLTESTRRQRDSLLEGTMIQVDHLPSVIKQFEHHAKNQPNQIALVESSSRMTYAQLDELATQFAMVLSQRIASNSPYIGICLKHSYRIVVAILSVMKLGYVYVPMDRSHPIERLQHIYQDCDMAGIIVDDSTLQFQNAIIYQENTSIRAELIKSSDLAYAIYTSGTTGLPKGVVITQRGLTNLIHWHQQTYQIDQHKKIGLMSPFTFDAATWMLWSALANGAELHLASQVVTQDPIQLQQWLLNEKIHQAFIPAAMLNVLLQLEWSNNSEFNEILTGGEKVMVSTAIPKSMRIINHYGPTECTVLATANLQYQSVDEIAYLGKPIFNTSLIIQDSLGRASPRGIPGELYIAGMGVSPGYISQQQQNCFFEQGYQTGDIVRVDLEGHLEYLGRTDSQIKLRGYRIELGEIENVLSLHPQIKQCCAKVSELLNGQKAIILYYSALDQLTQQELQEYASHHLPAYMIPQSFVHMHHFKLTSHGKIDREQLPKLAHSIQDFELAKNDDVGMSIKSIIQSVLKIDANTWNPNKKIFDYGADSISIMQIVQQLHAHGYHITSEQIFRTPQLSEIVQQTSRLSTPAPTVVQYREWYPVTPIQQWYLNQANIHHDQFNQYFQLILPEKFDLTKLQAAFLALIKDHDILTTQFKKQDKTWMAKSKALASIRFLQRDCDPAHVFFDLSKGPLIYVAIDDLHNPKMLLISIHHLAIDVVSWSILFRYLEQHTLQQPVPSAPSFKQWADLVRSTKIPTHYREFWKTQLALHEPSHNSVGKNFNKVIMSLPRDVTQTLLTNSNQPYQTETIHLILLALYRQFTGSDGLTILLEGHGRVTLNQFAATDLLGWFTTFAPYRLNLTTQQYPAQIAQIKQLFADVQMKNLAFTLLYKKINRPADVSLNYLGIIRPDSEDTWLKKVNSVVQITQAKPNHMCPVELLAYVASGQLTIEMNYDVEHDTQKKAEQKLKKVADELRRIIRHCNKQDKIIYQQQQFADLNISTQEFNLFINKIIYPHDNAILSAIFPMTPLQRGMQYHALRYPDSDYYHVQNVIHINLTLDVEQFTRAVLTTLNHYDVFKTGFTEIISSTPMQFVLQNVPPPLQFHDWSLFDRAMQDKKLQSLLTIDRQRLFNLAIAPLVRIHLIQLAADDFRLILTYHHILLDGWSFGIVLKEIFMAYHQHPTHSPQNSMRPYVDWLLNHKQSSTYWHSLLKNIQQITQLSNEKSVDRTSYQNQKLTRQLNPFLLNKLQDFSTEQQLTLNSMLLASWFYVIARYSYSNDILIGTTIADRDLPIAHIDQMVGLLNVTLPVRARFKENDLFCDFIKRVQLQIRQSQKHQSISLSDIQKQSGVSNHNEFINYLFVFENYPLDRVQLSKLGIANFEVIEKTHYKMTMTVVVQQEIQLMVTYDPDLFNECDIERMLTSYELLLHQIDQAVMTMRAANWLSPEHQKMLFSRWSGKSLPISNEQTLADHYHQQLALFPNKRAITFNDISLSYLQLHHRSNQVAMHLLEQGVKPGDVLAVVLNRDFNLVFTLIAIMKLGCTALPIDPSYPCNRIEQIIELAKPKLIVTKSIFSNRLATQCSVLNLDDAMELIDQQPITLPAIAINNLTAAYILFTSGSTGTPKGIRVSYAGLINFLFSAKAMTKVNQANCFLKFTTYTFDIFNYEFHLPFIIGAQSVLVEHGDQISPKNLIQIIQRHQVDVIQATPFTWLMLFNSGFKPSSNQTLISGGEVLTKALAHQMLSYSDLVFNIYGPSETTVWSSCQQVTLQNEQESSIPIGMPMHNTYFYILNSAMQLVPENVTGTLYIGGAGVGLGYLNKKLTSQKFIPDPFKPNHIIYNAGDLVKMTDKGEFLFLGRKDNQIKNHGYRIELSEIENQIYRMSEIRFAAVVVRPTGDHDQELVAFICFKNPKKLLTKNQMQEQLKNQLPNYMVPHHFHFLTVMPLTSSGKIDRKSLEIMPLEIVQSEKTKIPTKYLKLARLWSDVLALDLASVSIDDHFFDVGGNSIAAVSLIAKLNHELNSQLGVNDLFVYPTIRQLHQQMVLAKKPLKMTSNQAIQHSAVCLQSKGEGAPVFLLHPIGGTLYIYQPLVKSLGQSRPIFGISDPSINSNRLHFKNLREMAGFYISVIKAVQPTGPYFLLGASFGANMAEEITKQLIQQGESVAFTGLIDGWAHYPAKSHQKNWFYANLTRQHHMVASMIGQADHALPTSLLAINWHRQQLLAKHALSYSENKIVLFKANELTQVLKSIDSEFNYWELYYPHGLDLHRVPGNHETMLLEPNVGTLAEKILHYLK